MFPITLSPDETSHYAFRAGEPFDKPIEDAVAIDSKHNIICIADGVTRTRSIDGIYPNPSPAAIAAKTATQSVLSAILRNLLSDSKLPLSNILPYAFGNANEDIAKYANRLPPCDYLVWDSPGVVMTATFLTDRFLYYGHIGDGRLILRMKNDQMWNVTTNQTVGVDRWAKLQRQFSCDRQRMAYSRSHFRNRRASRWSYGVLTGEDDALSFVEYGRLSRAYIRQIIVISDGLSPLFDSCQKTIDDRHKLLTLLNQGCLDQIISWAESLIRRTNMKQDDKTIAMIDCSYCGSECS